MAAILESLGREDGDVVDYIRYYWITLHGQTRSHDLFDAIKKEVHSESTALTFTSRLESRANDYAALLTSSHNAWQRCHQEVRAKIDTLRYLGISQVRPVLLAAYNVFTRSEMEKLFKTSVNWSVRFLLAGVPSGTLEGHYSRNAKGITDGKIKTTDELGQQMADILPTDDKFHAAVRNASVPTASLARYYLRRLQMEADGSVEPQYVPSDGKDVTLEHILPVKPGPEWKHIPSEDAKANYNRLGNQALLAGSVNSRLGNVAFLLKKPALQNSPFSLTNSTANCAKWGVKEIAQRQNKLADLAVKAWPLSLK